MGWQWHQLDHMQIICTLLQTDNHASTSSLIILQADALPDAQPTVSKHWRQKSTENEEINRNGTCSMNAMANPTKARCISNDTVMLGCRIFIDCSTERGIISKQVRAPAGGGGLWWLTARILHSMSAVSRMYVLTRMIKSFFNASERTSSCDDLGCRSKTYKLRHLHTATQTTILTTTTQW